MSIRTFPRRVRIIIVSNQLSSEQITAAITLLPDTVRDVLDRQGAPEATWEINTQGTGEEDISEMLERILERIRPVRDHVAALVDEGLVQCIIRIVQYIGNHLVGPGFAISSTSMHLLSHMGAALDVDQYLL